MYMGPVTITRGTRAPPTQSCAFPVKGAGGAIRARRLEHGHLPVPRLPHLGLYGCNCWDPLPTANAHHPHLLIYYFLTRSPQFSNPNEAGNEYERKWEATAAQHHPEDLQTPRGRVPPATGHRRHQGAACCFQTPLQPRCSTMVFPAQASTELCPVGRPRPVPCSSGSQHRGRLREFRPQCRARCQGLSWAAIPGLNREHLPTTDTHGGLRGLVETGIKSLHCMSDVFPM